MAFRSTSIRKTIHKTTQSHIILKQNKITLLEIQNLKFKLALIFVSGDVEVKREPHERFNFMELLLRKKISLKEHEGKQIMYMEEYKRYIKNLKKMKI